MKTLVTLRRFAATLTSVSPRGVALTALVMVSLSFTEGAGLLLLVPLLQSVGVDGVPGTAASLSGGLGSVIEWLPILPSLGLVLLIYVGIAAAQSLLQHWHMMLSGQLRLDAEAMLRMRLYRAIARTRWVFFARTRGSDFNLMLTQELDRIGAAAHDFVSLAVSTLIVAVYVAVAIKVSPAMTMLVLGCGAVLGWLLRSRVGDSHRVGDALFATRAELNAAVTEHLGSMKAARCYGAIDRHDQIFSRLTRDVRSRNLQSIASFAGLRQHTVVGSAIVLAVIVYVSRQALAIPTAHLLMLLFLFARLMPRLTGLIERAQSFALLLPSFARFDEVERKCLAAAEPTSAPQQDIVFNREIRFANVSFSYSDDAGRLALQDVNLTIAPGTTTAIVGPSGAGKTTVADLLLGLIEPTSGKILVDGQMLEPSTHVAWRDQIGYVSQETFLFHDTVRNNLLWARPGASDAELQHVLYMAAADSFVQSLPQGLDTVIGDRGVLVSGGERQRLALARALLRRPRLLILDEATNALDSENELRIQEAIDALRLAHMTIVLITHRLSTVRSADVIHVIDRGLVIESGCWDELIRRSSSRFVGLCEAQRIDTDATPEPVLVGR